YLGIMYSDFRNDEMQECGKTLTDTWLAIYKETEFSHGGDTGVGLEFHKEVRLSQESYIAQNGPKTETGIMTNGDYDGLQAHADRFYAIYTKSFNALFASEETFFEESSSSSLSSSTSSCTSATSSTSSDSSSSESSSSECSSSD